MSNNAFYVYVFSMKSKLSSYNVNLQVATASISDSD